LQVKLRGFRVELAAVESVLQKVAGLASVAVVVLDAGTADACLAAYCTPCSLSEAALLAACSSELPVYMIPEHFVLLAELPKTANGKIDKKALPSPDNKQQHRNDSETSVLSSLERSMLSAVAGLLHKSVGLHDRLFDVGLNSLSAMKLAHELKIPVTSLQDHLNTQHVIGC
jgi:hypothetical protein